jgi:hypothetical protein
MALTIFDIKPIIDNGTEEEYKDLLYPSIRYNFDPYIINVYAPNDLSEMRPDIASKSVYGTVEYWDILMKFNGISNPFTLSREDRLLVPSLDDMAENIAPSGQQDQLARAVRQQYIDVSKKAKQDPRLAELEKKRREAQRKKAKGAAVASVSNLPPNIAEEGDREIIVKGGKVQFGPNISRGKSECEVPLSKSEFISKLIKNRLNG